MTQSENIENALLDVVENYPDKSVQEIITAVEEQLGVPRPSIRRVKRELLIKLNNYVVILK